MNDRKSLFSIGGAIAAVVAVAAILVGAGQKLHLLSIVKWLIIAFAVFCVLLLVLVFFAVSLSNKAEKLEREAEGAKKLLGQNKELWEKSSRDLTQLRMKGTRIQNIEVRNALSSVCTRIERILKTLKEQPEEIPKAKQCLTYYIPTLGDVIANYLYLETNRSVTEDLSEKMLGFLSQVDDAMDRQYSNLFENEKLEMSVDMEVMSTMLKKNGLL